MNHRVYLLIAISSGFIAVLLGAFGAHALKSIASPAMIETWKTASFYHFIHTAVLLIVILKHQVNPFTILQFNRLTIGFILGMCLFSGSLYLYVMSQITFFAMITPIGGLVLLLSWAYWFRVELSK